MSIIAFAALALSSQAVASCTPVPGLAAVLGRPNLTYLMIGEYHGTNEMPAFAADTACHATATGRPLLFGIEFSPADQAAIDAYMKSDGGASARAALLASPGWKQAGGRSTAAIADLLDRLRQLARSRSVRVLAFDAAPEASGTSSRREAAMATALMTAAGGVPGALVVVFTGIGHADKEGFTSATPPFKAAAGHLPADRTVSLAFGRPGGQYWACATPAADSSQGCKAYDMPTREPAAPRSVVLDPSLRGGFDGIYHPGRTYTASHPAVADAHPLPVSGAASVAE